VNQKEGLMLGDEKTNWGKSSVEREGNWQGVRRGIWGQKRRGQGNDREIMREGWKKRGLN